MNISSNINNPRLGSESSSPGGSIVGVSTSLPTSSNQLPPTCAPTPLTITSAGGSAAAAIAGNNQMGGISTPSNSGTPPNSATGFRFPPIVIAIDDKKHRRTAMQVPLSKRPSSDSLCNSPGPGSPGISNWADCSKNDGNSSEKSPDITKLNRKESYKAQRKNYRREKKRVASELLNSLQDPAVIVLADWLKVRGTLKSWTKLWCVLKPGLLLLYKSPKAKSSHWVGTVLITSCQVIERPSKKDGFCFKLFHPMEQSIWAPRGPDKETIGAVVQPLPTAYLIFRAPSQAAGKCWMDALELSLRCSALLLRSNSSSGKSPELIDEIVPTNPTEVLWSEADYEKHFDDQDLDADSQNEGAVAILSGLESESDSDINDCPDGDVEILEDLPETPYIVQLNEEEFGGAGEQVEELPEEHKNLVWFLVKQVRPGMDLSKVVLPTFILEPRSFLDKLSDSYYHADILSRAVLEDDPYTRMKIVVQWYLSGFYKKPKGLKKPYNPILGETFRCYWEHKNGSRTFYVAEQVSHHPPISVFYVTNRQDGFSISCNILAKSKFYGNSTSAILEGIATLTLLPRGESYSLTVPYANCKGILMGTLSMELGGKVCIECENTGYKTEIEFKLKPFLGGAEYTNVLTGKIKLGKETLATISGHWDNEMKIKESKSGEESILFCPTKEVRQQRLKRHVVPIDAQGQTESEKLWQHVTAAILNDDQVSATEEKTVLEEAQRHSAKERKATLSEWISSNFQQDLISGDWIYKYADLRPWDPRNDLKQFEYDYRILTKTRHQAPMVRTASIISSDPLHVIRADSRSSLSALKAAKRAAKTKAISKLTGEIINNSDSSQSNDDIRKSLEKSTMSTKSVGKLLDTVERINKTLEIHAKQLHNIQLTLDRMKYSPQRLATKYSFGLTFTMLFKSMAFIFLGIFISFIVKLIYK